MFRHLVWCLITVPTGASRFVRGQESKEWVALEPRSEMLRSNQFLEFHGNFRDLSLWRDKGETWTSSEQKLWVVEYESPEELESESKRASSMNLIVLFRKKDSLVIQGDVPSELGYDACGGEKGKNVITVSESAVTTKSMPQAEVERYKAMAQTKDPRSEAIQKLISRDKLRESVETLVDYTTRNSYSADQGLDQAADWAAAQLAGYGFTVTRDDFQPGGGWFSRSITPQIIAEYRGTERPDRIVVLGAHMDAIAGWNTAVAPGADDNGSGSAVVLELARIIAASGVKFKHTLRVCLFTGEEQGLLGSRAIARRWKDENLDIIGMLNVDMIGYRPSGQPIVVSLLSRNADVEFTDIVLQTAKTYLGDKVEYGYSSVCCSDQQSFYENGFPATAVFETPSSRVVYPDYHKTSDLLNNIDFEQVEYHATAIMASMLLFAEISN